ncbi:hypothetical protein PR202_ga14339 [Eleusine coracana subsp. coracana]|uniref:Uncharacterized protein n=1 Tax=Eleusine coracana subsp. coracana TaxID=191504 RepID=A0AAV5CH90_ELECO|nr:hypothetical protein PR202_ga14339 [Eleusine coracana subsp. coracana]
MSPEKKRMVGLWEREVGRLAPKHFANAVMASQRVWPQLVTSLTVLAQDFVHSLNIQKRLRKHRGCVNTLSFNADGSLLLSGSDDRSLALWNWEEALPTFTFHTGHSNNVLHAQFMHLSDDRSIVSCAADGEVRHSKIQQGGCVITDELVELEFAFDLRGKDAVELFKCGAADHFSGENVELFAIAIDPRKPCFFAVAGSDDELLASYSYDNIYLFSAEHGLHFNNVEVEAEMWHSSSSDSDAFFYYNDYDYMMDSDDDLYIETDDSVEDIDTSEDSSEEDENSDNSAKEDGDGDNSGG